MVTIRKERLEDKEAIYSVNELAFGQSGEADLVDRLRARCQNYVSLVAVESERIVGHILFTPATIETKEHVIDGMGLAPLAVLPVSQRQGIGTRLVQAGLAEMANRQQPFVIVLGHPDYYPRFGFVPASRYGVGCEFANVPDDAFMILVLQEEKLAGVEDATAKYRPEFLG